MRYWLKISCWTKRLKWRKDFCCKLRQWRGTNLLQLLAHTSNFNPNPVFEHDGSSISGLETLPQQTPFLAKAATLLSEAMESAQQIDAGAITRLRREAKAAKRGSFKQVQMLSQALSAAVSLDAFLPKKRSPDIDGPPLDDLLKRPTLICTSDEERKQRLSHTLDLFSCWFLQQVSPTQVICQCQLYICIGRIIFTYFWYFSNKTYIYIFTSWYSMIWFLFSSCLLGIPSHQSSISTRSAHLRIKWVNQLQYGMKLRLLKKQDYHHRSANDAKAGIQQTGLWSVLDLDVVIK